MTSISLRNLFPVVSEVSYNTDMTMTILGFLQICLYLVSISSIFMKHTVTLVSIFSYCIIYVFGMTYFTVHAD